MGKRCVVVTGGGTGGHLKVADCFIEEFFKQNIEVIYIGSKNGQDRLWFENDKRLKNVYFLDTKGVVNKNFIGKIKSLLNIFSKVIFCFKLFMNNKINIVVSVGGYSAAPATFASILKRNCNLYIHEQNSKMGKLNQISSKFAKKIYSSFDNNSQIKDYPVDDIFFKNSRIRIEIKTVAFFGGSQGAVAINNFALQLAPKLKDLGIKIIHQTGKNDYERVKKEYEKMEISADVFDFSKDISIKMNEADFAVSRAGASTLWELCANGLPTFFIPYKYAASDHQYFNALGLFEKKLCFLQREENLASEYFFDCLNSDIQKISIELKSSIKPNATSLIVNNILNDN